MCVAYITSITTHANLMKLGTYVNNSISCDIRTLEGGPVIMCVEVVNNWYLEIFGTCLVSRGDLPHVTLQIEEG